MALNTAAVIEVMMVLSCCIPGQAEIIFRDVHLAGRS